MRSFRLTLAYDGTGMVGWQRQASGTSVQALVEAALAAVDGRPVTVAGAGRTDAGVHALGQIATFTLERDVDPTTLVRAVNFHLPPAVRAIAAAVVDDRFHARFSARSKVYRYQVWNGEAVPPMLRPYAWHVRPRLDVRAMDAAARGLEGTHDFAAFMSTGTVVSTTARTIFTSQVHAVDDRDSGVTRGLDAAAGTLINYDVAGDGFLRHMVRSIVGSLVDVGQGRRDPSWLQGVLASKDRGQAGPAAPAEGLFLVSVSY